MATRLSLLNTPLKSLANHVAPTYIVSDEGGDGQCGPNTGVRVFGMVKPAIAAWDGPRLRRAVCDYLAVEANLRRVTTFRDEYGQCMTLGQLVIFSMLGWPNRDAPVSIGAYRDAIGKPDTWTDLAFLQCMVDLPQIKGALTITGVSDLSEVVDDMLVVVPCNGDPPTCRGRAGYWLDRHLVALLRVAPLSAAGSSPGEGGPPPPAPTPPFCTRSDLTWRINGQVVEHPTLAQLGSLVPGRDGVIAPPRAKADPWGEQFGSFPVIELPPSIHPDDDTDAPEDGVKRRCVGCKQITRNYWCEDCDSDFKCRTCGFCPGCTYATPPPRGADAVATPDASSELAGGPGSLDVLVIGSRPDTHHGTHSLLVDHYRPVLARAYGVSESAVRFVFQTTDADAPAEHKGSWPHGLNLPSSFTCHVCVFCGCNVAMYMFAREVLRADFDDSLLSCARGGRSQALVDWFMRSLRPYAASPPTIAFVESAKWVASTMRTSDISPHIYASLGSVGALVGFGAYRHSRVEVCRSPYVLSVLDRLEPLFERQADGLLAWRAPCPALNACDRFADCHHCGDTGVVKGEPCWYCSADANAPFEMEASPVCVDEARALVVADTSSLMSSAAVRVAASLVPCSRLCRGTVRCMLLRSGGACACLPVELPSVAVGSYSSSLYSVRWSSPLVAEADQRLYLVDSPAPLTHPSELIALLASRNFPAAELFACEYTGAVLEQRAAADVFVVSVDHRDALHMYPHYRGDMRDVVGLMYWERIYFFPPCYQHLRGDVNCLPLKIADHRAFWAAAVVLWCLCCDTARAILVEQPDTIVFDYLDFDAMSSDVALMDTSTACLGDTDRKRLRLLLRNFVLPDASLPDVAALPRLSHKDYDSDDARDRARSSFRRFPVTSTRFAQLAVANPAGPAPLSYAAVLHAYACVYHAAGFPVPADYANADARPSDPEQRLYVQRRGRGDGRRPPTVALPPPDPDYAAWRAGALSWLLPAADVPRQLLPSRGLPTTTLVLHPSGPFGSFGSSQSAAQTSGLERVSAAVPLHPIEDNSQPVRGSDDEDCVSTPSMPQSVEVESPYCVDLTTATDTTAAVLFLCVLAQPLIYAHTSGMITYGVTAPAQSRSSLMAAVQVFVSACFSAISYIAYMVGEYRNGPRIYAVPVDYRPPDNEICTSPAQRNRLRSVGVGMVWCTLAALAGTPIQDAAARSVLSAQSFVKPISQLVDHQGAEGVVFQTGVAASRSVLTTAVLEDPASPTPWRYLADVATADQSLLQHFLAAIEAGATSLMGWPEQITPPPLHEIPPELLESPPDFTDERLDAILLPEVQEPLSTKWYPRPPRQPDYPTEAPACVRSVWEFYSPLGLKRALEWFEHERDDLVRIRYDVISGAPLNDFCPRDRPEAIALGQGLETQPWARGYVWDCTFKRSECCVPLDFHEPINTHLNVEWYHARLRHYPDQTLVSNIVEGATFDADVELQNVMVPHLVSLPKGYQAVEKELHRMADLQWYEMYPAPAYYPMWFNGQGSTCRPLEPDRDRRTTEGGGPRKDTWDADGLKCISINAASHIYHLPLHFRLDQRPEHKAWLRERSLDPPPADPTNGGVSKWPKERKPLLAHWQRAAAIFKRAAEVIVSFLYSLGDDVKDFFNQLEVRPSERPKLGTLWLKRTVAQARVGEPVTEPHQPWLRGKDPLVFISERKLGFGMHGNSNIAQRLIDSLLDLVREDMDQVQAPFIRQAVGGELTWYRSRLALQRERGLPCVDIHRLTCAKDECLPDISAPAEPADIPPGYICPQLRLYSALGYTDDIIYQCVTPQVCVRLTQVHVQVCNDFRLMMARPEKRSLGSWSPWLGVLLFAGLGLVVVPRAKILRARQQIAITLEGAIEFADYRSLCGLLEHLRAVVLKGRHVMHGLYHPHGPDGASSEGPNGIVAVTDLMRAQLERWLLLLLRAGGVSVKRALLRDQLDPPIRLWIDASSDACWADVKRAGMAGYIHGYFWYIGILEHERHLWTIPVLEFLALAINILFVHQFVRPEDLEQGAIAINLRTDALAADLTLTEESMRCPATVRIYQELITTAAWRELAPFTNCAHAFGDANPCSDLASRAEWMRLRRLARQLNTTLRVMPPPDGASVLLNVALNRPREAPAPFINGVEAIQFQAAPSEQWEERRAFVHQLLAPADDEHLPAGHAATRHPVSDAARREQEQARQLLPTYRLPLNLRLEAERRARDAVRQVYGAFPEELARWGERMLTMFRRSLPPLDGSLPDDDYLCRCVAPHHNGGCLRQRLARSEPFCMHCTHVTPELPTRVRPFYLGDLPWSEFLDYLASVTPRARLRCRCLCLPCASERGGRSLLVFATTTSSVAQELCSDCDDPSTDFQKLQDTSSFPPSPPPPSPPSSPPVVDGSASETEQEPSGGNLAVLAVAASASSTVAVAPLQHATATVAAAVQVAAFDATEQPPAAPVPHPLVQLLEDVTRQQVGSLSERRLLIQLARQLGTRHPTSATIHALQAVIDSVLDPSTDPRVHWQRRQASGTNFRLWRHKVHRALQDLPAQELPVVLDDAAGSASVPPSPPPLAHYETRPSVSWWRKSSVYLLIAMVVLTLGKFMFGAEVIRFSSVPPPTLLQRLRAANTELSYVLEPTPLPPTSTSNVAARLLGQGGGAQLDLRARMQVDQDRPPPPSRPLALLKRLRPDGPTVDPSPLPASAPAPPLARPPSLPLPPSPSRRLSSASSALRDASNQYARARALALTEGGGDMAFRSDVAEAIMRSAEVVQDFVDFGINPSTLKKDERAWLFWEQVCESMGTNPLRTAQEARDRPERNAHLLAMLMFHAVAVCKPRTPGRQWIKPTSALAYPLAIIRIFARWSIPMPGYKMLKAAVAGLARDYLAYHGPHSLAPRRAEPMKFDMVRAIWRKPLDPNVHLGMLPWCDSQQDVFILRRLCCFLMHTGFRLAEIVGNGSSEIMYLTLDCLTWRINGRMVTRPTRAQLASLVSGRDVAFVKPPRSKPDQWGELHCPFPVVLTFNSSDDINPAACLRDIELRYGINVSDRASYPLFATGSGHVFSHHHLHSLLRLVLTDLFGAAVASLYTFHSFRSGLATALHAAKVEDPMIMLICRWMCPESLHVYRRMGTAEHESHIVNASRVSVDSIQTPNIVRVAGDQSYAELTNQFACAGFFAREAYEAALRGVDLTESESPSAPTGDQPGSSHVSPAPPTLTLLTTRPALNDAVIVPSSIWPRYRCRELHGAGWAATVLASTAHTAVVRLLHARTHDGRPYRDERIPWALLAQSIQ